MILDLLDTSLPSFAILVDGVDIAEQATLVSLETSRALDRLPYAHLVLQDGDPAEETFALSEGPLFPPGAEVEVLLGYNRTNESVFKGIITRQRVEAPRVGSSRLHVEVRHPAFKMSHARKSRIWQEVTDGDALADLAESHGVRFDGTTTTIRASLVQHQATDWDFAVMRAQMIGQCLLATDDGLTLVTPGPQAGGPQVRFGQDIYSIEIELDAERQPSEVETGAWDSANQGIATVTSEGPTFVGPGNTDYATLGDIGGDTSRRRASGARDQAELDDWAGAEVTRRRISVMRGLVEVQGKASFQPGDSIDLQGLGARFNGQAFVSAVRHQLARGDWRTYLQLGIDPSFHHERVSVDAPAASGLLPGIRGLQVGTVDALEGDPAGEARVAVKLVTETETDEVIWARPLSIGGGADRGFVMLPEVGDEVFLGFLDGDPRDPILLGGAHSSAAANPYPGADANHVKGVSSREGMKIIFDDEAVKLTLETPSGHKVVLDDEESSITLKDSNGNTVVMSSDGIVLESGSDISMTATGDIKLKGTNFSVSATAEVKAEGSAGAKLTSSGQTTIEGSLVMIN